MLWLNGLIPVTMQRKGPMSLPSSEVSGSDALCLVRRSLDAVGMKPIHLHGGTCFLSVCAVIVLKAKWAAVMLFAYLRDIWIFEMQ